VRQLNQLELVHETLRYTLNDLATEVPAWLMSWVSREWFDRYSRRTSNILLPKAKTKRQQWAEQVGEDGLFLLTQVYHAQDYPQLAELAAVERLRQVWVQNFYQENGQVRLRKPGDQPPSAQRMASPYDADVRYSSKRNVSWAGYKVHLTETCDADTPNLITHVETRPSTEPDHETVDTLHHDLAEKDCLPGEHLVDQGYMSVDLLLRSRQAHGIDLVGLVPGDNSWQVREGGYDSTQFAIDWDNQCAICPQGKRSCSWTLARTASHRPVVKIKFRLADCGECPTRDRCMRTTKHVRRTLTVLAPQAHYEAQQRARQRQVKEDFQELYAVRAGVEGTMSQAAVALGGRRSRYRGMAKTHFQHVALATAMNLLRSLAWINEVPRSVTKPSRFAALAA
jgi:transposase